MLPVLNFYFDFLMDIIVESSDEDLGSGSLESADESGENVELSESEENIDDTDDDPDYIPGMPIDDADTELIPMDDTENTQNTQPQSSPEDVQASAAPAVNEEQNASKDKPVEVEERPIVASQRGLDEEGQSCTICFEPWTSSSEHRLVSLRCGHLFGRSCITRWLKGQNSRCPQCNARARKSEIRNIYAKTVKVIDSSERDRALQDLVKETELRKRAEFNAAQERMRHMMATQECERLKKELMDAYKQLQEYRSGVKSANCSQVAKISPFSLVQNVEISKDGGCRIVDSCNLLGMILVSQPSSNPLFRGYGLRKISTHDMKPAEFVHVHQKAIRDIAFHSHDGLVLTASLDKSLKLTNVFTNSVVQTHNLDADVWSCTWDVDDPKYFYGGLRTGEVFVFDIRVTNRYVYMLPDFGARAPVVSLEYLSKPLSSNSRNCGPIVGKLTDCALHQKTVTDGEYNVVPLPSLGPFTSLSSEASGHFLVSTRPSPKQPRITHTLCDFVTFPSGELVCSPVRTILGGRNQVKLTRSKLISHPDQASSLLVCAGDEDSRGALIWDGSTGSCIDNLQTDSAVLDFSGFKTNHKSFLAALTDSSLRLYGWNSNHFGF